MSAPAGAPGGKVVRAWIRAIEAVRVLDSEAPPTLASLLDTLARDHGSSPALEDGAERLSYGALAALVNQIARWAIAEGLGPGTTICLLMPNRAAYVAAWLGLTRAGCSVALLNTNLLGDGLLHGIRAARASHLIVDDELLGKVAGVAGLTVLTWSAVSQAASHYCQGSLTPEELAFPRPFDPALLVYTSGTTGLPKAAVVTHARVLEWSLWFAGMLDVGSQDRLYDCLPLYHSTGGIVGVGAMLVRGGSVLIGKGFSARRFWDDVADGGCTLFLYIGELCRFLASSPPHPKERAHRLRLAFGNGMHESVWERFRARFGIPEILEFYAATEGSVSLYNCEGKPGAIGRVPPFLARHFPLSLIRIEPASGEPLRDAGGLCVACDVDEPGEAIAPVDRQSLFPARRFEGYTDGDASERKLLRDVFAPGDCWFRSGDLMRRDAAGFFYFLDRMGDTFRWKGENVSTTEVAAVVRGCPGVVDAVVHGVAVPGQEGRAGMAAVVADAGFDLATLAEHLRAGLPAYAQPVFVRLCRALELTGTFKLSSARLAREGFAGLADPVWIADPSLGFVRCDSEVVHEIESGARRL